MTEETAVPERTPSDRGVELFDGVQIASEDAEIDVIIRKRLLFPGFDEARN